MNMNMGVHQFFSRVSRVVHVFLFQAKSQQWRVQSNVTTNSINTVFFRKVPGGVGPWTTKLVAFMLPEQFFPALRS